MIGRREPRRALCLTLSTMANKRRATSDSDGEDQLQDSQASKRARTQDQSDEESEPEVSQQKREKKGKGKTTRRGDGEDDHETEQPAAEYNEEEEKMFEETHGEAIRARLDAKRKVQGVSLRRYLCQASPDRAPP